MKARRTLVGMLCAIAAASTASAAPAVSAPRWRAGVGFELVDTEGGVRLGRRLPAASEPELEPPMPLRGREETLAPDDALVSVDGVAVSSVIAASALLTADALAGATETTVTIRTAGGARRELRSGLFIEHEPAADADADTLMVLRDGTWMVEPPVAWRVADAFQPDVVGQLVKAFFASTSLAQDARPAPAAGPLAFEMTVDPPNGERSRRLRLRLDDDFTVMFDLDVVTEEELGRPLDRDFLDTFDTRYDLPRTDAGGYRLSSLASNGVLIVHASLAAGPHQLFSSLHAYFEDVLPDMFLSEAAITALASPEDLPQN